MNTSIETRGPRTLAKPQPHLAYLDGIRAMAALYVVLAHIMIYEHMSYEQPQSETMTGLARLLFHLCGYGHFAVDLFIVLSGFSLMLPVLRNNGTLPQGTKAFYIKRCRRILPPYYLSLLASCLIDWLILDRFAATRPYGSQSITGGSLVAHLLLLQDLFHDPILNNINGSLWTISIEFRIYFLFPLLVLFWRTLGPLKTTLLSLVASYALLFALHYTPVNTLDEGCSPQYIALFVYGMLAASIAYGPSPRLRSWNRSRTLFLIGGSTAALSVYLASAPIWRGHMVPLTLVDALFGVSAACLLICASHAGRLQRCCAARLPSHIGRFAYSLYLIHASLLLLVWFFVAAPLHLSGLAHMLFLGVVGVPLIVMGAYLFFMACERPFLNRKTATT